MAADVLRSPLSSFFFLTLSFPIVPTFSRVFKLFVCVGCDLHKPAPCLQRGVSGGSTVDFQHLGRAQIASGLSGSLRLLPGDSTLKLLLPPLFICDANQPPASCLLGADSISQGAHLLQGPFIKSTGAAADLRQGRTAWGGGGVGAERRR